MQAKDIIDEVLVRSEGKSTSKRMLEGTIPGASVFHYAMIKGDKIAMKAEGTFVRILFLCSGDATFTIEGKDYNYAEKVCVAGNHIQDIDITANSEADLVEIRWQVVESDIEEILNGTTVYPITCKYSEAEQYRDPFKSLKTISRAIIPQRVIPRFAMGSVETYDEDLIGKHAHPLLDQFFFTFPENNMDLLVDDLVYPLGGDTLLYIPLGSNHGVQVKDGQTAHYIWIDFIQDAEAANAYLDEVHKPTGEIREFEDK